VLFAPGMARVWAQSAGTLKLLQLPKIALVIGNSGYRSAPLKNPANDAKAISQALGSLGFAVTTRLDASRTGLTNAVNAFVDELAEKQCVGLFYYAGHGIQLGWKNYLLPVDMQVSVIRDVPAQGVEVNALMQGLGKAGNALNVVILDACRDNPFGSLEGLDQKGLSQMDAPNQTLLAYATAPGNVASDGDGSNGLYTENLLREMRVPEAKLEDVFKRVRLSVRLKSRGAQVPWESTSLEEDFWFVPPRSLVAATEEELQQKRKQAAAANAAAEAERLFKLELALWEKASAAGGVEAFQDYLFRYPSGRFSELAQLRLDQELAKLGEKKVVIASSQGNPYTQGSATADTRYQIGDTYTYRTIDLISKVEQRRVTETVTQISDGMVSFSNGFAVDLLGNLMRQPDGRRFGPNQNYPLEFAVGRRWTSRYSVIGASGLSGFAEREFRITGKEHITVPAGTFDAFVVVTQGFTIGTRKDGRALAVSDKHWFAPEQSRRPIMTEEVRRAGGSIVTMERHELVSFKQA
jgi:uncharacterized caspase-like protein